MNVMLVSHIGYPWGGVSQRYSDLLESSLPKKIDLTFFESSPNIISFASTGKFNLYNLFNFFRISVKFFLILLKKRPFLVHIASAYGLSFLKNSVLVMIAKLAGCKVILAPHCSLSVFLPRNRLLYLWMRFVLSHCDGLLVLSKEWLGIQEVSPRLRVQLLGNAIDLSSYVGLDRSINQNGIKSRILFMGHIGVEKGVVDLINAVKIIVDNGLTGFEVSMYGESSRPGELQSSQDLVARLSLEDTIRFLCPVFGEQKIAAFQEADIFVLPSYHEGMPISIIEAMASALPVVATRVGGIPDLIENEKNGILVETSSPGALAAALTTLIEDQILRYTYGMAGRKRAIKNHDMQSYADQLLDFYYSIEHINEN